MHLGKFLGLARSMFALRYKIRQFSVPGGRVPIRRSTALLGQALYEPIGPFSVPTTACSHPDHSEKRIIGARYVVLAEAYAVRCTEIMGAAALLGARRIHGRTDRVGRGALPDRSTHLATPTPQAAVHPPSTISTVPVTKLASSLAR